MSTIVEPIKKMTNLIKARMPQHPFSEPEYTFPHSVCKRQPSPGSSPLKKRFKEQDSKIIDTATTLPDTISR